MQASRLVRWHLALVCVATGCLLFYLQTTRRAATLDVARAADVTDVVKVASVMLAAEGEASSPQQADDNTEDEEDDDRDDAAEPERHPAADPEGAAVEGEAQMLLSLPLPQGSTLSPEEAARKQQAAAMEEEELAQRHQERNCTPGTWVLTVAASSYCSLPGCSGRNVVVKANGDSCSEFQVVTVPSCSVQDLKCNPPKGSGLRPYKCGDEGVLRLETTAGVLVSSGASDRLLSCANQVWAITSSTFIDGVYFECARWSHNPGHGQAYNESCLELARNDPSTEYRFNEGRGTKDAECGEALHCWCCRRDKVEKVMNVFLHEDLSFHVAVAAISTHLPGLVACLLSLVTHTSRLELLTIHIFTTSAYVKELERALGCFMQGPAALDLQVLDPAGFELASGGSGGFEASEDFFAEQIRLYLPEVLPRVRHVVALDVNTMVRSDIRLLLETSFVKQNMTALAAAVPQDGQTIGKSTGLQQEQFQKLGLETATAEDLSFIPGFMVLNLEAIRASNLSEPLLGVARGIREQKGFKKYSAVGAQTSIMLLAHEQRGVVWLNTSWNVESSERESSQELIQNASLLRWPREKKRPWPWEADAPDSWRAMWAKFVLPTFHRFGERLRFGACAALNHGCSRECSGPKALNSTKNLGRCVMKCLSPERQSKAASGGRLLPMPPPPTSCTPEKLAKSAAAAKVGKTVSAAREMEDALKSLRPVKLRKDMVVQVNKNAFEVALPSFIVADEPCLPHLPPHARWRSTLQLYYKGRPLGPPHSPHDAIERDGDGRYSHWRAPSGRTFLRFSFPAAVKQPTASLAKDIRLLAYPLGPTIRWASGAPRAPLAVTTAPPKAAAAEGSGSSSGAAVTAAFRVALDSALFHAGLGLSRDVPLWQGNSSVAQGSIVLWSAPKEVQEAVFTDRDLPPVPPGWLVEATAHQEARGAVMQPSSWALSLAGLREKRLMFLLEGFGFQTRCPSVEMVWSLPEGKPRWCGRCEGCDCGCPDLARSCGSIPCCVQPVTEGGICYLHPEVEDRSKLRNFTARVLFVARRPLIGHWRNFSVGTRAKSKKASRKGSASLGPFDVEALLPFFTTFCEKTHLDSGVVDLLWIGTMDKLQLGTHEPRVLAYWPWFDAYPLPIPLPGPGQSKPVAGHEGAIGYSQIAELMVLQAVDKHRGSRPRIVIGLDKTIADVGPRLKRLSPKKAMSTVQVMQDAVKPKSQKEVQRLCNSHFVVLVAARADYTLPINTTRWWLQRNRICHHNLLVLESLRELPHHLLPGDVVIDQKQGASIVQDLAPEIEAKSSKLVLMTENSWSNVEALCVYTVLTGGYDEIEDITMARQLNAGIRFIFYIDHMPLKTQDGDVFRGWEIFQLPRELVGARGNHERSRVAKFLPGLLPEVSKCGRTMYMDANTAIRANLRPLFASLTPMHDIGLYRVARPHEEEIEWIHAIKNIEWRKLQAQVERYAEEGFNGILSSDGCVGRPYRPACNVTFYGKILVRDLQNERGRAETLGHVWWRAYKEGVHRDQLSLPYALWKSGASIKDFGVASRGQTRNEPACTVMPPFSAYFARVAHNN